ncbi:(d)CMP kinase [Limnoglobus roseus]|uniref:Cytidylate kinase n=1 Tax=Limnoglobus roseus TaxID=2598579 RepID=A0A5C1A7W4_9BACT|nr:(d)CMP kinase [Limnoglobus roseus]QEL13942.1 (d)CMP kinase [Limnoglobus roseus]
MIVTIDGYAGSGKSAVAKELAARLGFSLLNTGAMYRAVGFALHRAGIDAFAGVRDAERITDLLADFTFAMPGHRILLNGEDLTAVLFTEAMGRAASKVATFPEVRAKLKAEQRRIVDDGDYICEGRDQGTAVFPDAPAKFFLRASAEVRAERRVAQLLQNGQPADYKTILVDIRFRDRQDETRSIDPLAKAGDAVEIDTSHLTLAEVVQRLWDVVQQRRSTASPAG